MVTPVLAASRGSKPQKICFGVGEGTCPHSSLSEPETTERCAVINLVVICGKGECTAEAHSNTRITLWYRAFTAGVHHRTATTWPSMILPHLFLCLDCV